MKKLKKNLVVGGGGIKGLSFLGALDILFKFYSFENFESFSGVSIGSFIIVMLNIDYSIEDLKNFFINNELYNFTDYKLSNLVDNYGLDKGTKITNLVKAFFKTKNIDYNITFKELFNLTKKNIYICGSNISKDTVEYFSHFTNPNMSVLHALRISVSVPIIFSPIQYNNDYFIDGVFFEHYPIKPFKNELTNTVSILLEVNLYSEITSFETYLKKIISSMTNYMAFNQVKYYNNKDLYNIKNVEDNPLNFNLNNEEKLKLYNIGAYSIKNIICNNIFKKIIKKIYFKKLANI
jgi:predicted acylesterase/phospholipase RssA